MIVSTQQTQLPDASQGPMLMSPSIEQIIPALLEVQQAVSRAPLSGYNTYVGKPYVTLPAVWDTVKPALGDNGLMVIHTFHPSAPGTINITTTLAHISGEWIAGTLTVPLATHDPQGVRTATTYARRDTVCAMLGVVFEENPEAIAGTRPPATRGSGQDARRPDGAWTFPFGKHKGKAITDQAVPLDYLEWFIGSITRYLGSADFHEGGKHHQYREQRIALGSALKAEITRRQNATNRATEEG